LVVKKKSWLGYPGTLSGAVTHDYTQYNAYWKITPPLKNEGSGFSDPSNWEKGVSQEKRTSMETKTQEPGADLGRTMQPSLRIICWVKTHSKNENLGKDGTKKARWEKAKKAKTFRSAVGRGYMGLAKWVLYTIKKTIRGMG